jgi:hypothetical protein
MSVPAALSQSATKGGIQGIVKDDSGKPVAGAFAVATGVGTPTHQSHTVTTTATGAYSFTGLDPGQYQLCVQTPGGPNLDPCHWSQPALITVSSGLTTANQTTTAVKGSVLQVRINDPLKLLTTATAATAGDIIVGILLPQALFQPMRLASSDSTGRTYDTAIPFGMPVKVQIHSTHLEIADSNGISLAPTGAAPGSGVASLASASTLTVQAPTGTATQVMTFSVTGKK